MRTLIKIKHSLIFVALLAIAACAHNPPNTTPQANVAHYGADMLQGVTAVQQATISASETTPPLLTVDQATPVMNAIRRALDASQQLATALKAYDTASGGTRTNLALQINALLVTIATAMNDTAFSSGPPAYVAQVSSLVSNVTTLIAQVRAATAAGGLTP